MNRIKAITNFATQIFIALCLFTFISCTSSRPEQSEAPKEKPAAVEAAKAAKLLEYEEVLTAGATNGETLPLLVAVHGLGGSPKNFRRVVENLKGYTILLNLA